jgi:PTS system nitrogen regulatory IIA component
VDGAFLVEMLAARESLGSTSVGHGIAIPHVRSPIILDPDETPLLSLCFLEEPADMQTIDGIPVRAVFTLVSPTIRVHLDMLSRLASVLRVPRLRDAVTAQRPAAQILALVREIETSGGPGERVA